MTNSTPAAGDIVLVAVPFGDGQGDLLLLALTSQPDVPGGVAIAAGDLASGHLDRATEVRPEKLNSIEARRIQRVIGSATPAVLTKGRAILCPLLGCS